MITIRTGPVAKETTLNEVPTGTVFTGTIKAISGHELTGLFLKARNNWSTPLGVSPGAKFDVLVVELGGQASFWTSCQKVLNYEPVDITIEVSPVQVSPTRVGAAARGTAILD